MKRVLLGLAAAIMISPMSAPVMGQVGGTSLSSGQSESKAVVYGKLLNTTIQTVEFDENPLKDVIDFLSQMGDVDILAKWSEDSFGEGLNPEKPITLHVKKPMQLLTILELVLNQATEEETTWLLGEGYVEIGTKDVLNKNKYLVIYPIRELLFEPTGFDNAPQMDLSRSQSSGSGSGGGGGGQSLFSGSSGRGSGSGDQITRSSESDQADELIDIITNIVDPYQWERNGGEGGSIRYFRGNLIINASDYLHRQVGGYPFVPARVRSRQASLMVAPRYVSLTGRVGITNVIDIAESEVPILVGGKIVKSGGGG